MRRPALSSRIACAFVALSLAWLPARAQLPSLGGNGELSVAAERRLGQQVVRELFRDPDYIEDPVIDEYVLRIWTRLLAASRARGDLGPDIDERFAWEVLIGKDREINAFALPGGYMGLNLGLVSATASADEVAGVLGHELTHVTQRHISRMMTKQSQQMPLILAAMVLGALAAGRSTDAAQAAIVGGQALAAQNQINFTRDMEREADRIGMQVAMEAGYSPQGFMTMFEKLQLASRLNDNGNYPYLRTHPMTTERIAEIQQRIQLAPSGPPRTADMVHLMMAGRARVLSEPGVDVLRSFVAADALRDDPGNRAREAGALYAGALAYAKMRDFKSALALAQRLSRITQGNAQAERQSRLLAAEISLMAGDAKPAEALADSDARPELVLSSQARIRDAQAAAAGDKLQTWVALHPKDAQAWQLLAQAQAAQGQTLRSVRAEAESRAAQLDWQGALDRLRAAQELSSRAAGARDHIEASIIDARAREMQSLLREDRLQR
ncbi:MAG TPA: M48 family metalloprotease [Ramlibacter sp.]|nr:M48 family metalloprotease [Ramlibacter sp.]